MTSKNVNELLEKLFENSWSNGLARNRSPYIFRGLPNYDYELNSTLVRLESGYDGLKFKCNQLTSTDLEYHLLRNFRKYSVIDGDSGVMSLWKHISVAQHHDLPTRLIDWTFSPFVALHFATCDPEQSETDGAVWCLNLKEIHGNIPESLKCELERVKARVFTTRMLDNVVKKNSSSPESIKSQLTKFDSLVSEMGGEDFTVLFEPPSMDDRIVNQYALFSIMSSPSASLEDWLSKQKSKNLWKKIRVPKELKWEMRNRLDQANITERILFPGMDGLASWLKRHYGPPPRNAK